MVSKSTLSTCLNFRIHYNNGIGYILKPIDEQKFIQAVQRYEKSNTDTNRFAHLLQELRKPQSYKSRITVKQADKITFVNIEDIAYFYAEDRVTFIAQKNGKRDIVDYSIEALEALLDPMAFFRVPRGCIASITSIEKVSKYFNSRLKVTLNPNYEREVLISRAKSQEFLKWLDGE